MENFINDDFDSSSSDESDNESDNEESNGSGNEESMINLLLINLKIILNIANMNN